MKRVLRNTLALLCVGALTVSPALAASFPDVSRSASYADAVDYVSSEEFMIGDQKGRFNPSKPVTRAEMATILCNVQGATVFLYTDDTLFSDVPASHWANRYVVKAADLGLVSGYGNRKFGPSDKVTYEQAVTMLVTASGLGEKADARGGYPSGYLSVASEQNYLTGINGQVGTSLTRGQVAQLLYNVFAKQDDEADDNMEPVSDGGQFYMPQKLVLVDEYGIPDQFLPYVELYEDGSCKILINWAHDMELFKTTYKLQEDSSGLTLICSTIDGGIRFVEGADGTWTYISDDLGFMTKGSTLTDAGAGHIWVPLYSKKTIDLFAELKGKTFTFASGAGGWHTELTFGANGTFEGRYVGHNYDDMTDLYPHGALEVSNFTGRFTDVVRVDGETYSMRIAEFNCDTDDGTWEIRDGMKIVSADPYGMENADLFYVYLPGRYTGDLPEEFLSWAAMPNAWSQIPSILPLWGLYNVGGERGFTYTESN